MSAHDRSDSRLFVDVPPITHAKFKIIGIGGGGGKTVNRMIESGIKGMDFIALDTDVQALNDSIAPMKIQLGSKLARGLGKEANLSVGRDAALDDIEKIVDVLEGADMVFVTTGLGGETGTGAAPVVASLAIELGALTVAVVTKPYAIEGKRRLAQAEQGLAELSGCVDTIITIPNSKREDAEKFSFIEVSRRANDIILQVVQGIWNLINTPGIINLDFADVQMVMKGRRNGLIGIGEAKGEGATVKAMKAALDSRMLDGNSIKGAKSALINIICPKNIHLNEIEEAISLIESEVDADADIVWGTGPNEESNTVKIIVIATDFGASK